ncbi:hypothetical protein ACRDNQ_03990 [Palleronia sp. KMU-117]|uniref:hypothetical protein n=1 Tax=Palleronia sp. KMU-117 TaxID=3434108 RepID=UPI003D70B58C
MDYTDEIKVEAYLTTTIDPSFATQLAIYIGAVSRQMDQQAGITLVTDTETTKRYDGSGQAILAIDPVRGISEVTISDVATTVTSYPANTDVKHELVLASGYFPKGLQNVAVTGYHARFATTVPDDIAFAATVLVAGIVQGIKEQRQGVKSETVGKYSVTYLDDKQRADFEMAKQIINSYCRIVC